MRRTVIAAVAVAVASGTALAASPASGVAQPTVLRLVERPVCSAPAPGRAACDGVELVQKRFAADARVRGVAPAAAALPAGLRGPTGRGYSPSALAAAYRLNTRSSLPARFVVAVVDACPVTSIDSNLDVFDAQYGLPAETSATYRRIPVSGSGTCTSGDSSGWEVETSLDVEAVRGVCPTCRILLVQGASPAITDLDRAVTYAAGYRGWVQSGRVLPVQIISNSYGAPENGSLPSNFVSTFSRSYIAIVASTGDSGWYGWDNVNANAYPDGRPQVPAALPTVVAVSGTRLLLNTNGTRASETVWDGDGNADNNPGGGAAGGGCSFLHYAPRWQRYVPYYGLLGCRSGYRSGADIAADADPTTGYDIVSGCGLLGLGCTWRTVGGTSLAAPLVAAMWALAGGPQGVRYPSLSLYGNFGAHHWSVYDVSHGGNGFCGADGVTSCSESVGGNPNNVGFGRIECEFPYKTIPAAVRQCHATAGYDGPSGVGAPAAAQVFRPLVPTAVITRPSSIRHGVAATFGSGSSVDPFPGGYVAVSSWSWGDGTTSRTTSLTPRHTYARAGTYTIRLVVTDNYGRISPARLATVTVA